MVLPLRLRLLLRLHRVLTEHVVQLIRITLRRAVIHRPLRQRMVLTRKAGGTARALYAFLQGPVARAIFKRYGFLLPGESAP